MCWGIDDLFFRVQHYILLKYLPCRTDYLLLNCFGQAWIPWHDCEPRACGWHVVVGQKPVVGEDCRLLIMRRYFVPRSDWIWSSRSAVRRWRQLLWSPPCLGCKIGAALTQACSSELRFWSRCRWLLITVSFRVPTSGLKRGQLPESMLIIPSLVQLHNFHCRDLSINWRSSGWWIFLLWSLGDWDESKVFVSTTRPHCQSGRLILFLWCFGLLFLGRHGLLPSELHKNNPRSVTTLGVVLLVHTVLVYEDMLALICHATVQFGLVLGARLGVHGVLLCIVLASEGGDVSKLVS